jgi:hypothetical protein
MPKSREISGQRAARIALAGVLAAAAVFAGLVYGAGGAGAAAAPKVTVVLGETPSNPDPSCPEDPCRGIASVTGFQVSNDNTKLPFRAPFDGTVKSWTITLSQPTDKQRAFFNNTFGRPPEAHLAVLKRVPRSHPPVYRLRNQSAIRVLSPYLGRTPKFRLGKPLRVRKGDIVALSVPTWAPAFAFNLGAKNVWLSSRAPGRCGPNASLKGRPQQKVNSKRVYGCRYTTARLLYTATVVKG